MEVSFVSGFSVHPYVRAHMNCGDHGYCGPLGGLLGLFALSSSRFSADNVLSSSGGSLLIVILQKVLLECSVAFGGELSSLFFFFIWRREG